MNSDQLTKLLQTLELHNPADAKERADLLLIRQMALANPEIFSKSCYPGHITGSALVLDCDAGRLLLHFHKSLGKWLQFGGHAEQERDPAAIAFREAEEESGLTDLAFFPPGLPVRPIDIDVHAIPAKGEQPDHLHLDFRYLLSTSQPEQLAANDGESGEFAWLRFDEVPTLKGDIDPGLHRLISKAEKLYQHWAG